MAHDNTYLINSLKKINRSAIYLSYPFEVFLDKFAVSPFFIWGPHFIICLIASGHECRLDDTILEAITKLKEPRGSSRLAISQYIEVMICYVRWKYVKIG